MKFLLLCSKRQNPLSPPQQYKLHHPSPASTCRRHTDGLCEHACTFNATTYKLFPFWRYLSQAPRVVNLDERSKNHAAVNTSPASIWANHWQIWFLVLSLSLASPTGPIRVILDAGKQLKMRHNKSLNLSKSDLWDAARKPESNWIIFISTCQFVQYWARKRLIF